MTPANPDALADALARELARLDGWQDPDALWTDNLGIIARGGEGSPVYLDYVEDAGKLIAGPLAPILAAKEAAEARAAQLQAEVEAKDRALTEIRDHPENYNDGRRSYAVGWAFWNIQNIARTALAARAATAREGQADADRA